MFIQYEEATFKIRKLESWSTGDYDKCTAAKNRMIESLEIMCNNWLAGAMWRAGVMSVRDWASLMRTTVQRSQQREVYQNFCQSLYNIRRLRPALQALCMTPSSDD